MRDVVTPRLVGPRRMHLLGGAKAEAGEKDAEQMRRAEAVAERHQADREAEHRAKQHVRLLLLRHAVHGGPDETGHHEDGEPSKDKHQAERDGDRREHRDRRRVGQRLG